MEMEIFACPEQENCEYAKALMYPEEYEQTYKNEALNHVEQLIHFCKCTFEGCPYTGERWHKVFKHRCIEEHCGNINVHHHVFSHLCPIKECNDKSNEHLLYYVHTQAPSIRIVEISAVNSFVSAKEREEEKVFEVCNFCYNPRMDIRLTCGHNLCTECGAMIILGDTDKCVCCHEKVKIIGKEDETCSICLESKTNPCFIDCAHSFCKSCITKWLRIKLECPLCKEPVESDGVPFFDDGDWSDDNSFTPVSTPPLSPLSW